jgi:hypothetical protein
MPHIILNEEQLKVVSSSEEAVEIRDPKGNVLAHIPPRLTQAEFEEIKRRLASNQRRFSSQQVKEHFQALEEAVTRDGMNEAQAMALLKRLQATENG